MANAKINLHVSSLVCIFGYVHIICILKKNKAFNTTLRTKL
jgi:hypothetical protein